MIGKGQWNFIKKALERIFTYHPRFSPFLLNAKIKSICTRPDRPQLSNERRKIRRAISRLLIHPPPFYVGVSLRSWGRKLRDVGKFCKEISVHGNTQEFPIH